MRITDDFLSRRRNTFYWYALGLLSIWLCLPLLTVTYAPLVDYPNHLARVHILYQYAAVPAYQSMYVRVLEPVPNIAIELIIFPLLPFVDILAASKIFLIVNLLIFITGCHQLGAAIHGRPTWLALPCLFFFYNSTLLYGFVNYMVGVGLFCCALALRLRLRQCWTLRRFLLLTLLAFLTFAAHLSAYFFLSVAMVVVTAWDYFTMKEKLRTAMLSLTPLILPLVSFIAFMRSGGAIGQLHWNTVSGKLIGMLSPVLSYNHMLDVVLMIAFLGIAIVLVRRLESVRTYWPIFISAVIFALLYLASPKVLFGSSAADARLVLPAALLFTLSTKLSISPARARPLVMLFLLLASIRVVFIWRMWVDLDRQIAAEVEKLNELPSGAVVYPMFVRSENREQGKLERSMEHIVLYATIYRQALVPTLFSQRGQVNLVFRSRPDYVEATNQQSEEWLQLSNRWMPYLSEYDYVWGQGVHGELEQLLRTRCTKVNESDAFSLWRVNPQPRIHG